MESFSSPFLRCGILGRTVLSLGMIILIFGSYTLQSTLWGWRSGSVIKSIYCFCRGPGFGSQYPYQVAYKIPVFPAPWKSEASDSCEHKCPHAHVYTTHIIKHKKSNLTKESMPLSELRISRFSSLADGHRLIPSRGDESAIAVFSGSWRWFWSRPQHISSHMYWSFNWTLREDPL